MAVFITGSTGYLGSYVVARLLEDHPEARLALLVRAASPEKAKQRLWHSLQLHMGFEQFRDQVLPACELYLGDLTEPELGLDRTAHDRLVKRMESVIHVAASLNRKSAKACFNVNLRGTLSVIKLALQAEQHHGLRRFTDVSTNAVAGIRSHELVLEDQTIDWDRSDYDPYARTKKFSEHMIHELLPDVPRTVLRPSTVMGDSRFPETTQFDMVRAFCFLAQLPVLPFSEDWRMDIVPADWVGEAIATIHMADQPKHVEYGLCAGTASPTYREIAVAMQAQGHPWSPRFIPWLNRSFGLTAEALMSTPRSWGVALGASVMKVFMPYLTHDTVFDNRHTLEELGEPPTPFLRYAYDLLRFAVDGDFKYPYLPWPEGG